MSVVTRHLVSRRCRPRAAGGFSMIEVMTAVFIFAIGFASIAALFPAGVYMQRQAMDEVGAQMVAASATAALQARKYSHATLNSNIAINNTNCWNPITSPTALSLWDVGDRSYPRSLPVATPPQRRFFWVPLIRRSRSVAAAADATYADWQVFVFILRRDGNTTAVPTVNSVNVTGLTYAEATGQTTITVASGIRIAAGEQILDDNGQIHTVKTGSGTGTTTSVVVHGQVAQTPGAPAKIWYGVAGSQQRTTVRVIGVGDAVRP